MNNSRWTLALRPKTFKDVVGQESVVFYFKRILDLWFKDKKMLPVGALFCGQSGVGKTTLARVIASSLNCCSRVNVEPCGACPSCLSIHSGAGAGVYEIDSSFFGLVDNIRSLREQLMAYSFADYQVVILDECHMMSKEAFNVLLKLFEEVPRNVFFILITTEKEKVLETVRSRLLEFRFSKISVDSFLKYARGVLENEGVCCSDKILINLYRHSKGNLRDTLMSLEQLSVLGDGNITEDIVGKMFGDIFIFEKTLDLILHGRFQEALILYQKNEEFYKDFKDFYGGFFDYVSEILIQTQLGVDNVGVIKKLLWILYKFGGGFHINYCSAASMFYLEALLDLGVESVKPPEKIISGGEIFKFFLDKK